MYVNVYRILSNKRQASNKRRPLPSNKLCIIHTQNKLQPPTSAAPHTAALLKI